MKHKMMLGRQDCLFFIGVDLAGNTLGPKTKPATRVPRAPPFIAIIGNVKKRQIR